MELFEEIRREYRFGVGTIQGVAKKLKTHRRMVRQALASAIPPGRKIPARNSPKLGLVREFIDGILQSDREAPRKQRHTAHRPGRTQRILRSELFQGNEALVSAEAFPSVYSHGYGKRTA